MTLSNLTPASILVEYNLQRKQNWIAKSTNLRENAGKVKSVFVITAPLWADYCRRKNSLGKLAVAANLEPPDSNLNKRSVSDGGNWCPLRLVIRRHLLAAIQLAVSCSELYFARSLVVKRTGTFASESKVMWLWARSFGILRYKNLFRNIFRLFCSWE